MQLAPLDQMACLSCLQLASFLEFARPLSVWWELHWTEQFLQGCDLLRPFYCLRCSQLGRTKCPAGERLALEFERVTMMSNKTTWEFSLHLFSGMELRDKSSPLHANHVTTLVGRKSKIDDSLTASVVYSCKTSSPMKRGSEIGTRPGTKCSFHPCFSELKQAQICCWPFHKGSSSNANYWFVTVSEITSLQE